MQKLE